MSVGKKTSCGVRGLLLPLMAALILVSCFGIAHAQRVIVPVEVEWNFLSPDGELEDPGDTDPSFDTTWFTPGYDDSGWESEMGPLSYGDIAEGSFLDVLIQPVSGDRYTNYFRYEFNTNRTYNDLGVDILADDGAVVYLDGQEVLRFNCCDTPEDDYLSFASSTGTEDSYSTRIIDTGHLAAGDHLLAVSVHQVETASTDLGLGISLLADVEPPPPPRTGVDTFIRSGAPDETRDGASVWEWDGSDGGGENLGLLKVNLSAEELAGFGAGTATLQLTVVDPGDSGNVHRMTEDWLSGPAGGNVSFNNIPGGPGIVPGQNAEETRSFSTGGLNNGVHTFDVSEDVMAWASGVPNYGWGFIPTSGGGLEVVSFEANAADRPQLTLEPGDPIVGGTMLQAGDADQDLDFDQFDLIKVQIAGKYLTGQAATWGDGDWNAAPGGSVGNPPAGDGFFNQLDIIAASLGAKYLTGKYGAIAPGGETGDGQTSIVYDANTGEVAVDAPAGVELTSINIDSAAGVFTGEAAANLGGSFDNDVDDNIFKATFGGSFGSLSFGNVAQSGLSEDFVANDLTVVGSLNGGGDLGAVDLIYVPEPSALVLFGLGLAGMLLTRMRKRD